MHKNRNNREPKSPTEALLFGIFAICFGVFWTVMAGSIFPPMAIFGILWTAIAVTTTVNSYKNAKKPHEHQDFSEQENGAQNPDPQELRCPYCGAPIHKDDRKCEYCDSRL